MLPDFDAKFNQYLKKWIAANADRYENIDEAIDELGYEIYNRWLNEKVDWLDGKAPGLYFDSFSDARELIGWMQEYHKRDISLPGPLLDRITSLGGDSLNPLLDIAKDADCEAVLRMTALGLLQELDLDVPPEVYLDIVAQTGGEGPLAHAAADALEGSGVRALQDVLAAMEGASLSVRLCLMNVLSNFPKEESTVRHALELFDEVTDDRDRALVAAYLAKLGDAAATPRLMEAAMEPDIPYLVYVEVRDALDALGGGPAPDREFAGDPMYEALRGV